jgi:predicted Zn finger-like uncharacterized protein
LNFSCDNCGRKYSIGDDRVGDKGVKIRCKHCQHVIVVKPPPLAGAEESTRMVSLEELERGGVAARAGITAPRTGSGGSTSSGPRGGKSGAAGSGGARSQRSEPSAPLASPSSSGPGTASPWEGEATRAVVAPDPNAQWFAMVKGQQVGPFDLRGLSGKVKQGEVSLKTFVWHEGMSDWKRAEELPELALMFAGGMSREERGGGHGAVKVEAVKSIAAALQKSAGPGGMRTSSPKPTRPSEATEETKRGPLPESRPDEAEPMEADPDNLGAPMTFDLSIDGSTASPADGVDFPGLAEPQELDLMATAATLAEAAAAPVTPAPAAPAPAMSSAAAVTVTPSPTRKSPRKSKEAVPTPMPPAKAEAPPAPDPEPAPDLEPDPEPEPAPAAAAASNGDLGSDLFSDLDLRRSGEHQKPLDPGDLTRTADEPAPNGATGADGQVKSDPFAKAGKIPVDMMPKPGQATNFVIAQAGVNKRNPVWKIAIFVVLLIGLPLGVLYALSELNVVPLQITHVDQETGQPVTETVFSKGGLSGLRDLLTGKKAPPVPAKDPAPAKDSPKGDAKTPKDKSTATAAGPGQDEPNAKQLADLYQDGKKKDVGPAAAKLDPPEETRGHEETVGGPAKEEINKVVEATQRAFQFCIEQELKKNPAFKGGKVRLVATVGASGVVKKATIDREDIDQSDLGECLKGKAKRMSFSAFTGDDVDLEIPLILSTTM